LAESPHPPSPDAPGDEPDGPSLDRADKAALVTVWLTLFLDLVGFGIVLPVLPFYAEHFGASPQVVTLLSTGFSLAQFLMSPVLGRLGDRYGRRPIMLISIAGSCASMLVLGFAASLWMVFVARVVSGASSANVSTAQAYVADRVHPSQRAKYMGLMGSAIGLGFIFGPAIGGLLSHADHPELPFLVAAGMAAINWVLAFHFLPGSPDSAKSKRPQARGGFALLALGRALESSAGKTLGGLVLVNFMFYLAFAAMESTFALSLEARFGWGGRETGLLFTGIGVVIIVVQGMLVGRLVKWLGEKRTLMTGMGVLSVGLFTTGAASVPAVAVGGASGIAGGNGFIGPSISALISRSSGPTEQGLNLGIASSAASLARIIGPAIAGVVFEAVGPGVPMMGGAGLVVLAIVAVALLVRPPRDD
jgi:MFS family permease